VSTASPTTARAWVTGARPWSLPASASPVLVGCGVAVGEGAFSWPRAVLALVVALALQVGVNYANDYSDGVRGTDAVRLGPARLVGSGAASPAAVRTAAVAAFAVACAAGLVLAAMSSWWLVLVGALAVVAAWTYTGGPMPYGYRALGEPSVLLFFGLVPVVGTAYVQTGEVAGLAVLGGLATGALACAILVVNNLRDIPTDTVSGKRTLAVLLGDTATRHLYACLIGASPVLAVLSAAARPWALLAMATAPGWLGPVRQVLGGAEGMALVPALVRTTRLELGFALLLAVGLAIG